MVNEHTVFGGFLTNIGEERRAQACVEGKLWSLSTMCIGDASGEDFHPDKWQYDLINRRYRTRLNRLDIDPKNPKVIIAEAILPPDIGGWWIRELGLEDDEGNLVAVANCPPSFKPLFAQGSGRAQIIRMHLLFPTTANVQLINDPSSVLVTRSYLEEYATKRGTPIRGIPGTYVLGGLWPPQYALRCPTSPTLLEREVYPALFEAITSRIEVRMYEGNDRVRGTEGRLDFGIGTPVCGIGIQAGTTVIGMPDWNILQLSKPTTMDRYSDVIAAPWGLGDGISTFGMPWFPENTPLLQGANYSNTFTPGEVVNHIHPVDIDSGGQSQGHSHAVIDHGHSHVMPGNSGMGNSGGGDTLNQNPPRNGWTNAAVTGISLSDNNADHFHKILGNTGACGGSRNLPAGTRTLISVWY